jgi:hypothetical protein
LDPTYCKRIEGDRIRLVHGTGWSAFITLATMLDYDYKDRSPTEFTEFLFVHAEQAMADVVSETFLTRFWRDGIISGIQRGKVHKSFFEICYVISDKEGKLREANEGDADAIKVCYIGHRPVYADYEQDMRARGNDKPLDVEDIRREMSKEKYWLEPPRRDRVHRNTLAGIRTSCWVISLEKDEHDYIFPFAEDLIDVLNRATASSD